MAKIVTMGEIMLKLTTPKNEKYLKTDKFDVCYGGSEANVAVSLANFGHEASYITKVPENPIGECAVASLRKMNVDTKNIARGGERLGIYYLERGTAMRRTNMIYDRCRSAISTATAEDFDFDAIFEGADWFHFTGITPALSEDASKLTEVFLKEAKARGVKVSVDLNYRKPLWSKEQARKVMINLMQYVDVCIGNEDDAEKCLDFKPSGNYVINGKMNVDGYENMFRQMAEKFNFEYVISSYREFYDPSDNDWSACMYKRDTDEFYHSKVYRLHPIAEPVGGGDAFAGGVICGLCDGKDFKDALEFAVAASALKHTISGDFNLVSRSDVDNLVNGDSSGRVQR